MARITIKDVDLGPSLEVKAGDTMMGEILERHPNGNYRIRAIKRVQYKNGPARLVSVMGLVRAKDIDEDTDGVASGKLYDYRVEVAH
jgi:flagellar basal body L-ring protein FlgH